MVQVGDSWYHFDVTYNDPSPDVAGTCLGEWALLSTGALCTRQGGTHYVLDDWEYEKPVSCTNTNYDNLFWHDAISPFLYLDGAWYYVSPSGLMRWNGSSAAASSVVSFPELYREWYPSRSFSLLCFSSGLFAHQGQVYFNSSFHVLRYDPSTGRAERCVHLLEHGKGARTCYLSGSGDGLMYLDNDDSYYFVPFAEM